MINIESSSFLPQDLLIEILLYLPVKTLLQFKSVSKSWLVLIDSSEFIHRHTSITTTLPRSSKLGPFIFQSVHVQRNIRISWNFSSISGDNEFQMYEDLGIPPCYSEPRSRNSVMNLRMVGSCNGVICLYEDELRNVSLWNPAIHQFRLLPKSSLTFGTIDTTMHRDKDFVAFGFDLETKDYKVVLMTTERKHIHQVQVYSLSTDSWRTLEDVVVPTDPCPYQINNNGGYLNGSYYGKGTKYVFNTLIGRGPPRGNSSRFLIPRAEVFELFSFDFAKEIFKIWQLPDGMNDNMCIPDHDLGIIFLSGKVTIIHCHYNTYDFFVLNEAAGAKEYSWTRLYKIGLREKLNKKMRPMGISNDGEYIVMVTLNGQLWLLNSSTQVMKELQLDTGNQISRAYVYRRSLVPVCSTKYGSTSQQSLKLFTPVYKEHLEANNGANMDVHPITKMNNPSDI